MSSFCVRGLMVVFVVAALPDLNYEDQDPKVVYGTDNRLDFYDLK